MLLDFLEQTCTIQSFSKVNNNGTVEKVYTSIYTDIPCFVYRDKRTQDVDSRSTESNVGDIYVIIEPDKTNVRKDHRVFVTDPDFGSLGEYIVEEPERHRSFTGIDGITLRLKKIEDGQS